MIEEIQEELTFDHFIEAFVAGLVSKGIVNFNPSAAETNLALHRLSKALQDATAEYKGTPSGMWIRRLRNQIMPNNLGTYDSFFAALRAKQLGYVASPNPSYNDINFKISPAFALSIMADLDAVPRKIVDLTVKSFLEESADNIANG